MKNVSRSTRVYLLSNVINARHVHTVRKYSNLELDYKSIFKNERTSLVITVNGNSVAATILILINEAFIFQISIKKYTHLTMWIIRR